MQKGHPTFSRKRPPQRIWKKLRTIQTTSWSWDQKGSWKSWSGAPWRWSEGFLSTVALLWPTFCGMTMPFEGTVWMFTRATREPAFRFKQATLVNLGPVEVRTLATSQSNPTKKTCRRTTSRTTNIQHPSNHQKPWKSPYIPTRPSNNYQWSNNIKQLLNSHDAIHIYPTTTPKKTISRRKEKHIGVRQLLTARFKRRSSAYIARYKVLIRFTMESYDVTVDQSETPAPVASLVSLACWELVQGASDVVPS